MAYLTAKDVRGIDERFYELLVHAPGSREEKQRFFKMMKIQVPRTSYDVMWQRLKDKLSGGWAGEAVFVYVLESASQRLLHLLERASREERVRLRESERAVVWDLFWANGRPRRIGKHLLGYMAAAGTARGAKEQRMGKEVGTRATLYTPRSLRAKDAFQASARTEQSPPQSPQVSKLAYDVALSFAGEQRAYVRGVATALDQLRLKVFYDEFETENLWGKDLQAHFDKVYRELARLCVIFISKDYVSKSWPRHEGRSALARALEERGEYVLPVRFDDTPLPGLQPTIAVVYASSYTPAQLANLIKGKLGRLR